MIELYTFKFIKKLNNLIRNEIFCFLYMDININYVKI
jgi:hypothetical protein